jgi:hypothetical protein
LEPHDQTLDWRRVAEGILLAAEQMQYPDGEFAGCLPDSFEIAEQRRLPVPINPCVLIALRQRLAAKLDSLDVTAGEGHRVASPFPVTISGDSAVVEGIAGLDYQLLVDGKVVDVKSEGVDRVRLPVR